jgi:hypothetical protein
MSAAAGCCTQAYLRVRGSAYAVGGHIPACTCAGGLSETLNFLSSHAVRSMSCTSDDSETHSILLFG